MSLAERFSDTSRVKILSLALFANDFLYAISNFFVFFLTFGSPTVGTSLGRKPTSSFRPLLQSSSLRCSWPPPPALLPPALSCGGPSQPFQGPESFCLVSDKKNGESVTRREQTTVVVKKYLVVYWHDAQKKKVLYNHSLENISRYQPPFVVPVFGSFSCAPHRCYFLFVCVFHKVVQSIDC